MVLKTLKHLWRPAGLIYLSLCVCGMICGLYPDSIYVYPDGTGIYSVTLPVLQALCFSQMLFVFLVYPLVLMQRDDTRLIAIMPEITGLCMVTVPLVIVCARMSDATPVDLLRSAQLLLVALPLSITMGRLLARKGLESIVLVFMVGLSLMLPLLWYIFTEFFPASSTRFLLDICPPVHIWMVASQRDTLLPDPWWPGAVFLVAGVSGLILCQGRLRDEKPDG